MGTLCIVHSGETKLAKGSVLVSEQLFISAVPSVPISHRRVYVHVQVISTTAAAVNLQFQYGCAARRLRCEDIQPEIALVDHSPVDPRFVVLLLRNNNKK